MTVTLGILAVVVLAVMGVLLREALDRDLDWWWRASMWGLLVVLAAVVGVMVYGAILFR